jgi:hypothetical protein
MFKDIKSAFIYLVTAILKQSIYQCWKSSFYLTISEAVPQFSLTLKRGYEVVRW